MSDLPQRASAASGVALVAGLQGGTIAAAVAFALHFAGQHWSPAYKSTSFRLKWMVASMAVVATFAVESDRAIVRTARERLEALA